MILGISGKKHSGKNTVANIIHGITLKQMDMVQDWSIDGNGHLNVLIQDGWGVFDVTRRDKEFVAWAENNLYPYIKMYSFADALKWLAVELFDIPEECCFGTEESNSRTFALAEHGGTVKVLEVWPNDRPRVPTIFWDGRYALYVGTSLGQ